MNDFEIPVVYRPAAAAAALGLSLRTVQTRGLWAVRPSKGVAWYRADDMNRRLGTSLPETVVLDSWPTVRQAAVLLGVSLKTVHRWVSRGRLECRKPNARLSLIDPASLTRLVGGEPDVFLNRRRRGGNTIRTTGRLKA